MSSDTQSAALMDRIYQGQKHIYDVTRKYYLLGRDHLIKKLDVEPNQTVLELGCGTGRNLIAAAKQYPHAMFYGVDISQEMLGVARENIMKAGLQSRIVVAQGDATNVKTTSLFGIGQFDRVFYSYSLSMIPPWKDAMVHGTGLVKPGGSFQCVDFGQQEKLGSWFRFLLHKWLAAFHVEPRKEMLLHLEAIAHQHQAEIEARSLYRGYAWYGLVRM